MHFIYRITFILCIGTFMEFKKSVPTLLLSSVVKVVFDASEIAAELAAQWNLQSSSQTYKSFR